MFYLILPICMKDSHIPDSIRSAGFPYVHRLVIFVYLTFALAGSIELRTSVPPVLPEFLMT